MKKQGGVRNLKLVNVQKFNFEGLIPALYSIDNNVYDNPLLRDSKKVNLHFKQGHYDLILNHNKSCLLSILELVKNRYLKEISILASIHAIVHLGISWE